MSGQRTFVEGDLAETSQALHMKALVAWHCGTTMLLYRNIFDSKAWGYDPSRAETHPTEHLKRETPQIDRWSKWTTLWSEGRQGITM